MSDNIRLIIEEARYLFDNVVMDTKDKDRLTQMISMLDKLFTEELEIEENNKKMDEIIGKWYRNNNCKEDDNMYGDSDDEPTLDTDNTNEIDDLNYETNEGYSSAMETTDDTIVETTEIVMETNETNEETNEIVMETNETTTETNEIVMLTNETVNDGKKLINIDDLMERPYGSPRTSSTSDDMPDHSSIVINMEKVKENQGRFGRNTIEVQENTLLMKELGVVTK